MSDYSAYYAEVEAKVPLAEIIGQTTKLTPAGGEYRGICPFHEEKTGSFWVNPTKGVFNCFGCGVGGGIFTWLRRKEGLDFPAACGWIEREYGIPAPQRDGEGDEDQQRIYRALHLAQQHYAEHLEGYAAAWASAAGITEASLYRFGLGRGGGVESGLIRRGVTLATMQDAVLVRENEQHVRYDTMTNRLVFPLWDHQGRVVAFAGRALESDRQPKYLNTPEHRYWRKGEHLYAFHLARQAIKDSGAAVLVEGYTDVIWCHQAGMTNTVAAMGTALTPQQVHLLRRFASRVTVWMDGDAAGQKAAAKHLMALLRAGLDTRLALCPEGHDPASWLHQSADPAEAARKRIADADPGEWYLLDRIALAPELDKAKRIEQARMVLRWLGDAEQREEAARRFCRRSGLAATTLRGVEPDLGGGEDAADYPIREAQLLAHALHHGGLARVPVEMLTYAPFRRLICDLEDGTTLDEDGEALRARLLTARGLGIGSAGFEESLRRMQVQDANRALGYALLAFGEARKRQDAEAIAKWSQEITIRGAAVQRLQGGR